MKTPPNIPADAGRPAASCSPFSDDVVAMLQKAREDCALAREENSACKAALQNLSACCYGQTLTQSVLGAVALIEAYRTSEKQLRKKIEALEKCLAENT